MEEGHPDQRLFNLNLKEYINIRQVSMVETVEHASKTYLSTLAVLQPEAILTNARKVKVVPKDKNSKNQEKFDRMILLFTRATSTACEPLQSSQALDVTPWPRTCQGVVPIFGLLQV